MSFLLKHLRHDIYANERNEEDDISKHDFEKFEIEETAAMQCHTLKCMIEDGCADNYIPLANVTGATLAKVIECCKKRASPPKEDSDAEAVADLKEWEKDYMDVNTDVLYDVIMAANYLDIKGLLDLACQKFADMIKGKTPEQIRYSFYIKSDFTAEEEEEIRKEIQWAFE